MNKIKGIVIHCSDSSWGDSSEIKKWHLERGWKDIGYNGVILNGYRRYGSIYIAEEDGLFEQGRALDFSSYIEENEVGAHTLGYNKEWIGICLIGKIYFTARQFETAIHICHIFKSINSAIQIKGHYEMPTANGKTCPNFDMNEFRRLLDYRYEGAFYDLIKRNLPTIH